MDFKTAQQFNEHGIITDAVIFQSKDGWHIALELRNKWETLESARRSRKTFKTCDAALRDAKRLGFAAVAFSLCCDNPFIEEVEAQHENDS